MNVLPIITRELRAQARQGFTFTLRELGVVALLFAGLVFGFGHGFDPNVGGALFGYMHRTMFWAIWILVPFSAADCISRERREGTLGLLFLTPLNAASIVIAKSLAHGLRSASLLVAVLPVLAIPFLLGGVSWQFATISVVTNFSAVCWALAGALVASSVTRSSLRAMVGAVIFSVCALIPFVASFGWFYAWTYKRAPMGQGSPIEFSLEAGMALTGIGREAPVNARGVATGIWTLIFRAMGAGALAAVLVLVFGVVFAAWQIRRSWREEPPPVWVQALQSYLCTPKFWLKFFKRWMRWKIERNPIGWLEQRRWTGRLVTWTWFAIVISIYSAVFSDRNFFRDFSGFQLTIGWLMMLSIASSAAGSFRRERESGVLELLLVTPMTTNQIIGGRLRGLWGQFLPAIGCLLGIWLYFARILQTNENLEFVAVFAGLFLTLPIFGLYFSLRCRHFVSAFLLTIAVGLFPGWLIVLGIVVGLERIGLRLQPFQTVGVPISMMAAVQFTLAAVCLKALWRRLNTRSFPMERTAA